MRLVFGVLGKNKRGRRDHPCRAKQSQRGNHVVSPFRDRNFKKYLSVDGVGYSQEIREPGT